MFVHDKLKVKRSKTWDKNYYWMREVVEQKILDIFWERGSNNDADYFIKHHTTTYHKKQQPKYILEKYNTIQV